MKEDSHFEANRSRWARFFPDAASKLSLSMLEEHALKLTSEDSEQANLQFAVGGRLHTFHSPKAPLAEAEAWVKRLDLEMCEVLYVYGIGLGYIFEPLKQWLEDPRHFLVFVEDQLPVITAFFQTERARSILAHPQVWLFHLTPDNKELESFVRLFAMERLNIVALPLYEELYPRKFQELKINIKFLKNLHYSQVSEFQAFGSGFFRNYFPNLFAWPTAYLGDGLFGKFKDVPAIICGAGPSLLKNMALLGDLHDRALIFAGGTAMNAINAKDIQPHFGVGIDPNFEYLRRMIMNKAFDIPILYRNRINYAALDMVSGDRLYLSGNSGYHIADYFDAEAGIPSTDLEEGCNVVNFSLSIAEKLGCNPIILVGVDLAYSADRSYGAEMNAHPIHSATKKFFHTKDDNEELITYLDIHGQPVSTLWKWITESLWFTNFAIEHPHLQLINATEGGIGFSGIPNMTLDEVAKEFLLQSSDLSARVFGEIQRHPMSKAAEPEFLNRTLSTFSASLERAIRLLNDESGLLVQRMHSNHSETQKKFEKTAEELKVRAKLASEIGYKFLLKRYEEAFHMLYKREFWRLELDGSNDTLEKQELKRSHLKMESLNYLKNVGAVMLQIIAETVNQRHIPTVSDLEVNDHRLSEARLENAADLSEYIFDEERYRLVEPDLHINHIENFPSAGRPEKQLLRNSQDQVFYECHRREGVLHGPSREYGPDKQLLVQSWYIDGLKQGKVLQYFPSGKLYGIQRYHDGKRHGRQECYFQNGRLRSILHYKEGSLDGEVQLYHQNGLLARSLTFKAGKRNGLERIWDNQGQLTIEAEFQEDLPVGFARVWHPDGIMAQEIIYDSSGIDLELKRWDRTGVLLKDEPSERKDYIDSIAVHARDLTQGIANIVEQVTLVAPLISEVRGDSSPFKESSGLEQDFSALNEELQKLQQFQADLLAGLDNNNQQEAIWKTPELRRELEVKMDGMSKELKESMGKLQSSFKLTVEALIKRQKTNEGQPPLPGEDKTQT